MSSVVKLGSGGKASRTRTDDGDFLAGAFRGWLGNDPAVFPTLIDDRDLDVLDRHGGLVDTEHAGAFARGRADAPRELREVVGLMEAFQRFAPKTAVDEIVPLRNQVVDRAAAGHPTDELTRMAERDAAIHATGALLLEFFIRVVVVNFLPISDAGERIAIGG